MVIIKKLAINAIVVIALLVIAWIAVFVRSGTINSPTVLDYDPWWFYRRSAEIVQNNYQLPKWDSLSFYPPGRPLDTIQGWPYTIATFYRIASSFSDITLMKVAILAPLIMVLLTIIPAFLLGRTLTNNIGGVLTVLFVLLTPFFIPVSLAGYVDTDPPVVLHFFLSIFSVVVAIKYANSTKYKKVAAYSFAIIANLLFAFNWSGGWTTLNIFILFIPGYFIFRIIEEIIHKKTFKIDKKPIIDDLKTIVKPIVIIVVVCSVFGHLFGFSSPIVYLIGPGLSWASGVGLIVNISVAELQTINPFSVEGFNIIAGRIGFLPLIATLFGLPLLILFKLFRKIKVSYVEIFLLVITLMNYYLISRGVRFTLEFSIVSALATGYVIGSIFIYSRKSLINATVFGVVAIFSLLFLSTAISMGLSVSGLEVGQNWYDMLNWAKEHADKDAMIATWWDPGHIIAGYTGLKSHADGAHCGGECIPFNHNDRIRDMGKILSTSDENESVSILKKYKQLTAQQCDRAKKEFAGIIPEDVCKQISEIYVLASSDLIQKYYWLSFFGSFDYNKYQSGNYGSEQELGQGRNFIQMGLTKKTNTELTYSASGVTVSLVQQNNQVVPIVSFQGQNAVIKDLVFFNNDGKMQAVSLNTTQFYDAMFWIDPSFQNAYLMEGPVRDSVFTRMFFFNGAGLKNFDLVYQNSETKLFKVKNL